MTSTPIDACTGAFPANWLIRDDSPQDPYMRRLIRDLSVGDEANWTHPPTLPVGDHGWYEITKIQTEPSRGSNLKLVRLSVMSVEDPARRGVFETVQTPTTEVWVR